MSDPNDTLEVLEWQQIVPDEITPDLTFSEVPGSNPYGIGLIGVENYFGMGSPEATLAKGFFSGPNAASGVMEFARIGLGQRPHLLGANLAGMTLTQLQQIAGPISITFNGITYNADVNLASAMSFADAARMVQAALRHSDPVMARTEGGMITAETIAFTGIDTGAQLEVTAGPGGSGPPPALPVGSKFWWNGMHPSSTDSNQIIYTHTKLLDGYPHYSSFASNGSAPTPTAMWVTYSDWNPGTVTSGAIAAGDVLTGPGIPALTAVIAPDGHGGWILNNAINATAGNYTIRDTPLEMTWNYITGATENHGWFSFQPNGAFGFDANASTLSYASGDAANLLGLSQAFGAMLSSPGGQHPTLAQFLNGLVKQAADAGTPFSAVMDDQQDRFDKAIADWASKHPGETFVPTHTSAPPAGSWGTGGNIADGLSLLYQTAAIETYSRGDIVEGSGWGITASVGHGPGPGG